MRGRNRAGRPIGAVHEHCSFRQAIHKVVILWSRNAKKNNALQPSNRRRRGLSERRPRSRVSGGRSVMAAGAIVTDFHARSPRHYLANDPLSSVNRMRTGNANRIQIIFFSQISRPRGIRRRAWPRTSPGVDLGPPWKYSRYPDWQFAFEYRERLVPTAYWQAADHRDSRDPRIDADIAIPMAT